MESGLSIIHKETNVLGLSFGQAQLYKYLLRCYNEGKVVELHEVCLIYHTHVNKQVNLGWGSNSKWVDALPYYYEKIEKCKKENRSAHWVQKGGKSWLQQCIGSFVLRGMLTTIPKFNPKEIES